MAKGFKIFALLLLTRLSSVGQIISQEKVFYRHNQYCDFNGTIDEDLIIVLKNDSAINIITYTSDYHNQYNIFTRQMFIGTYSKAGDTLKVKFTGHSSKTKNNRNERPTFFTKSPGISSNEDTFLKYPSTIYLLSDNRIASIDGLLPTMDGSTIAKMMLLESRFNASDKSAFRQKEIIGVSN
jgi:hypothetical protein